MPTTPQPDNPVGLFYSYSHKDEKLRKRLESHLHGLKRQGFISGWHDRRIVAGADWRHEIDLRLEAAGIILLLISSDYIESDYCYGVEMAKALERYKTGEAKVIPVLLRPCEWQSTPFGKLQALPANAQPVTEWKNRDKAFLNIAEGVRQAVEEMHAGAVRVTEDAEALIPTYSDAPETVERGRWVVVISATVNEIDLDKIKAIEAHLRKLAEDTELTVMRVERGSVVIILEGTRRGFERINELLEAGQLKDLLGYKVEEIGWGFDDTRHMFRRSRQRSEEPRTGDRGVYRYREEDWRAPPDSVAPTGESFNAMLAWLAPDMRSADEQYEMVRQRLIMLFSFRGADDPEYLADETIYRVALKFTESSLGQIDSAKYLLAVARNVNAEYHRARRRAPLAQNDQIAPEEKAEDDEMTLLDECMRHLTAENRKLLLSYYEYEGRGRERREARKALARRLDISERALYAKVYRLRRQLFEWMKEARARQAERGGEKN
jgi:hypothetical protein